MAKKNKHPELDKWQKEIQRLSAFEDDAVNKKLFKYYRQALIDIKKDMKVFMDNYETLSFSKRLEAERLLENGKQIDKILRDMNAEVNKTVEKYVEGAAERGYYGNWYAIEGITGVHLDMNMLPENYIKELVHRPVKGQRFSSRLYKHRNRLAKETTAALLDAARTGKSYAVAAGRINEMTEASYKKALRIVRTEGSRVQSITKQRSYVEAKKKGVDIQKQWMSTLDGRTRHSHQHLDDQVVDIEGKFVSEDGYEADGPGLFGVAKEDIHCRCTTVTVVNGISPELRANNIDGKIGDYKNYNEWYNGKKDNNKSSDKISLDGIINKITPEHAEKIVEILQSAPLRLQGVWNKFAKDIRLGDPNYNGGAHYMPSLDGKGQVNMNMDKVINGTNVHAPMATFFHEFGHNIDYLANTAKGGKGYYAFSSNFKSKKYKGLTLRDMIMKESEDYVKLTWDKLKDRAVSEGFKRSDIRKVMAYNKIRDELMDLHYYDSDVADIWEGATKAKVHGKLGHGKKYWLDDDSRLNKEAFAEMFGTSISRPESLEKIKKYFPKSHEIFEEMIDDILKE